MSNQFYPKVEDILGPSKAGSGKPVENDWSVSKLKEGISNNRHLIEELQNLHVK